MVHKSPSFTLTKYGSGGKIPSNQGLFGGYPGPATFFEWMTRSDFEEVVKALPEMVEGQVELSRLSSEEYLFGHMTTSSGDRVLTQGDMWHSTTHSGASGLGDPLERDPELIVQDVLNRMVSLDVAQRAYAVAIDPETLEIDHEQTQKLREERKRERLEQGIPGIEYLRELVKLREERRLSKPALELLDETKDFCPGFVKELDREKEIADKGLRPGGKISVGETLFALTSYVDIVLDDEGRKMAVCSHCGFAYCEADDNFKYYCLIYDRDPADLYPGILAYDKEWCLFREFYCPSCASQVEVEACAPGSPILWNYELKL
jgi:hypothetical protein